VLLRILDLLHIKVSTGTLNALHFGVRKGMHFFAYGVLSALYFRALRGPLPRPRWKAWWAGAALAICLVAGSVDEWHQGMTPGRGGSWWDVVLDTSGALFAQLLLLAVYFGKRRPK
jgi:VanZ family protein